METKIKIESKFWQEVGKWCVAVYLLDPIYDCWFDSAWSKNRDKADKRALELAKQHIDFVREKMKVTEVREEVLVY